MKKAVVTGATGLVGMAVVNYLNSQGIEVLCLGRRDLNNAEIKKLFGIELKYIKLPMNNILSLNDYIKLIEWIPGDECVFYNFAWSGQDKLTDGDLEIQLNNAIEAQNAVKVAKSIGCIKFINVGTLEETFAEQWMDSDKKHHYQSDQYNYTIAKLASRDLCKIVAYLQKIDYIHTRLSVPLAFDLSKGSYISTTLRKIANSEHYEKPLSKKLFDIISTYDVAIAYYLIGKYGINMSDYFIGTSKPMTLNEYFEYFKNVINDNIVDESEKLDIITLELFNNIKLKLDTGFIPKLKFKNISKYINR